jgi:putative thioredoxin
MEPENPEVRSLLAQTILFDEPGKAAALVENVEDPRFAEMSDAVGVVARLHSFFKSPPALPPSPAREWYQKAIEDLFARNFDAALRGFIDVIRNDRYYDDDGSRKACIAIFKILGEDHEMTLKYRREFSSALYV